MAVSDTDLLLRSTTTLLNLFRPRVALPHRFSGAEAKTAAKLDHLALLLATNAREDVAALVTSITPTGVYISALTEDLADDTSQAPFSEDSR